VFGGTENVPRSAAVSTNRPQLVGVTRGELTYAAAARSNSLIDKGAVGLDKFFDSRPEAAGKRGENGFVDYPFLGGVIGIIINRNKVIEGFDEFCFRLGGIEVGRCRRLLPGCFFLFGLSSGDAFGRSLYGLRFCYRNDRSRNGRSGRLRWNRGCLSWGWGSGWRRGTSFCYRRLVSGRRLLVVTIQGC
jgi:hypothetical protein